MRWLLTILLLFLQGFIHGLGRVRKHFGFSGIPAHSEGPDKYENECHDINPIHTRILQAGRLLTITICLLFSNSAKGAAGDITGIEIETNGWVANVYIETLAGTNHGRFFNGFATNNALTASNGFRIDLVSMGFDSTGTATTYSRSVYGTKLLRLVTPNEAIASVFTNGTAGCMYRVALNDYIYDLDSNTVAAITSAAFVNTNNAAQCVGASGIEVTNSSAQVYPKVISRWTFPDCQRETNASMRLRAVGFHASARYGRPLVCSKAIVTDESGDAVTNVQTHMTIDRSLPDIFPTGEYIFDIPLASFTQGDNLRCDRIDYPWIGDANSVMDTTLNEYAFPTAKPRAITNLCDKNNAWGNYIAVVNLVAGAAPRVTNVAPALVDPVHYFGTGAAAHDQLAATNAQLFGHATAGGSRIFYRTGVSNVSGGTVASNVVPKTWVILENYPGDVVELTNAPGAHTPGFSGRIKVQGMRLGFLGANIPFSGATSQKLWLNQCTIDSPGAGPFQGTEMWATHCAVTNLVQGFRASTLGNNEWFNVRGCNLGGFNNTLLVQLFMGNYHPATNGADYQILFDKAGQGAAHDFQILYNNFFAGSTIGAGAELLDVMRVFAVSNDLAVVQNIFERTGAGAAPVANLASTGNKDSTNILLWNNLFVGERIADWGSSGGETITVWRDLWSMKGNIADLSGIKKDYNTPTDVDRIGNWQLMNMVSGAGQLFVECRVNAAAGTFPPEFAGLNSYHPPGQGTNVINFPRFTDRKAYDGGGAVTAGDGNYRQLSDGPGFMLKCDWLLPFDLEGRYRSAIDPPGPYASGNVKKGAFF